MVFAQLPAAAATFLALVAGATADLVTYDWRVTAITAAFDGVSVPTLGINDKPADQAVIDVELGQDVEVRVTNELEVPTCLHWHGLKQLGTQEMDGTGHCRAYKLTGISILTYRTERARLHQVHGRFHRCSALGPRLLRLFTGVAGAPCSSVVLVHLRARRVDHGDAAAHHVEETHMTTAELEADHVADGVRLVEPAIQDLQHLLPHDGLAQRRQRRARVHLGPPRAVRRRLVQRVELGVQDLDDLGRAQDVVQDRRLRVRVYTC